MKIYIIGNSGTGKTTLAREISKFYDIPHTRLDGLSNRYRDRDYMKRLNEILNNQTWIIEGVHGEEWGSLDIARESTHLILLYLDPRDTLVNRVSRDQKIPPNRVRDNIDFYKRRNTKQSNGVDKYWRKDLISPFMHNWAFHKQVWENHKGPKKKCETLWKWDDIKNFLNDERKGE